ncbi:hypothetical protein SAMN00120144_1442 [Hymenobacter roseosalivarius DSM 11622]|uniref:Uncharacterized protein n=1 Tax=Hymenobacter roseosalivarius DSM 11622 TaxID=645990 RepID=A0A1W1V3M1_9BACT|nr:hypothetical protein [Hymenobacter roseosalivarius]SMB87898.1 hypothetical protein SAMN00120144_1442 [Hymenobacter roseosalivarius DSM 11622]
MPTSFEPRLPGEGYSFIYRKGPSHQDGPLVCTHFYTFRTRKNRRYVVEAEQYQHHVYVLKFYPLSLKHSHNRFKLLVHDGDAFRILSTCLRVFADIIRRDPLASAGFVGEALAGEDIARTKRFRVYFQSVVTFVGTTSFRHHPMPEISAYFLENKTNAEPDLLPQVEQMFRELYIIPQALDQTKSDALREKDTN